MDVMHFIKSLALFGICFYIKKLLIPMSQAIYQGLWIDKAVSFTFHFIFTIILFKITKKLFFNKRVKPDNKAVLITGCDSGFGNLTARKLDSEGFRVYAACLQPTGPGATELKKQSSGNLRVLEMDVTKDESVSKAVEFVEKDLGTYELWAVVNNAGIHKGTSAELSQVQDFKDCLEVNFIGMVRVTKAFLPFLKKSKGRLVNIASLAGRLAIPYLNPYNVSKFAVVAFNDGLRREMDVWGVRVISIEPELFSTPIIASASRNQDKEFSSLDASTIEDYGTEFFEVFKKRFPSTSLPPSPKLSNVIEGIESAVTLESPDAVYMIFRNYALGIGIYIFLYLPVSFQDAWIKLFMTISQFPKPRKCRSHFKG